MARDQEPQTLDPEKAEDNGTYFATQQIFEQLVEQTPQSNDPQPGVASSWDIAPDGLSYTFHLRPEKFSNGDPLTAADVKFSLDRFMDPNIDPGDSFVTANIKDAVVLDPETVRMDMKQVDASVLAGLTLPGAAILPMKVFQQVGENAFGEHPIGSGPFMVKQWNRGQDLQLVRNPNYWEAGKPFLHAVTFQLVKNDNARILEAQSGEAQIIQSIPIAQTTTIKNIPGYSLRSEPLYSIFQVWLNESWVSNGSTPFTDALVRKALNYATPKDQLNKVVFNGLATVANSQLPTTEFWDSAIQPYPFDVSKAQQLMAQSTHSAGFTLPLMIISGDSVLEQTAEVLQSAWAAIGIRVEIQAVDSAVWWSNQTSLQYAASMWPASAFTSDTPDDSELAAQVFDWSSDWRSFYTDYKSAAASKLVQEAVGTTDVTQRRALYSQLRQLTMNDAPNVPLLFVPSLTAVSDKVVGFKTLPSGWWLLQDVCLSQ